MAVARPILGLLALVFLAGGIVLQFLVVLSGLPTTPENDIYFLEATLGGAAASGLNGISNPVRWTWLRICGVDGQTGLNAFCQPTGAAVPFSPVDNFPQQTVNNLPSAFQDHRNYYYYLSRISWAFYIVALFFAVVAVFTGLLPLCTRLGAYLSSSFTFLAVGGQAIAASLMTAWVVSGYRTFTNAGIPAQYGVKAIAFTWAAFAAWSIATILFCVGGALGGKRNTEDYGHEKKGLFRRNKSTRSRGSFRDADSGRRVKDDYE